MTIPVRARVTTYEDLVMCDSCDFPEQAQRITVVYPGTKLCLECAAYFRPFAKRPFYRRFIQTLKGHVNGR